MRNGIVAPRPDQEPGSAKGFRAASQSVVLAKVSDLVAAGAPALGPAHLLEAICEAAASHLALTNVVFFKRLAGQSRTLAWSAAGVSARSRLAAREQAWKRAAVLLDERVQPTREHDGEVAIASVWDDRLGLSALLYAESLRRLDHCDHALVEELLRRMLVSPAGAGAFENLLPSRPGC